jgi:acetyltransferase-like isoleucine patch superfamily enzyme
VGGHSRFRLVGSTLPGVEGRLAEVRDSSALSQPNVSSIVSASTLRAIRRRVAAARARLTVMRAGLAFALHGTEGVNRIVRLAPKDSIIPILRAFGASIGERSEIESALVLHGAKSRYHNLTVGAHCHVGKEVFVDLEECVTLADCVTVSMRTTILTHVDVGHSPLAFGALPGLRMGVHLRYGAYVGAGAILLPGVEIGDCAVVGAGSVVTLSVAPYTVVAGSPARVLRTLTAPLPSPVGS